MQLPSKKTEKKENIFRRIIKKLDSVNFGLEAETEYFIENLSMLLASGINIIAALDSIKLGLRIPAMKKLIDQMKNDIEQGVPMWRALEKTSLLPGHIIALFRIGEESGNLPENLEMIKVQQQKERMFKSKIKSAMMYPALVMVTTLFVGIGIAWFILPRLANVFSQLGLELPLVSKILINIGVFLGEYGSIVIPSFLLTLALIFYFVFIFGPTKFLGQAILFKIPGVGLLIRQTEVSRLGYVLGYLFGSSLPIEEVLGSLESSTTMIRYKKLYHHLKESIKLGYSFQKSFSLYPKTDDLIPAPIQQMIASGEQAGCLSALLLKIGEIFEIKAETTTKNLTTILEPLMLVIIFGAVMSVALAVLLPIYGLIGSLGESVGGGGV